MKLTDEEIKALRIKKKAISDDLFKAICQAMDVTREQETKKRNKRKYKW